MASTHAIIRSGAGGFIEWLDGWWDCRLVCILAVYARALEHVLPLRLLKRNTLTKPRDHVACRALWRSSSLLHCGINDASALRIAEQRGGNLTGRNEAVMLLKFRRYDVSDKREDFVVSPTCGVHGQRSIHHLTRLILAR